VTDITICPFCLSVFLYDYEIGAECPYCHIGILENIDEHNDRIAKLDEDDDEQA